MVDESFTFDVEEERSPFTPHAVTFLGRARRHGRKYGAVVMVTPELLTDTGFDIDTYVRHELHCTLDRYINPWHYPDKPAIAWRFDPFPRWTRLAAWWADHRPRRRDDDEVW